MEFFPVNHQFPNHNDAVDFPLHLTPFPDIPYAHPTAEISPPEMQHNSHPPPPPQKLRPIRFNGRTSPKCTDPTVDLDGAGHGCDSGSDIEFGFLNQLSVADVCGGSSATSPEVAAAPAPAERLKVEMAAECAKLISEGEQLLETELSLSSDDDGDSSKFVKKPLNRKRKRKTRKKIEGYLKNMMSKVLQKQELMHNQLIEMIEKNERERIIREEAWKQQEIERAKNDEEVRAEERSRTLVLLRSIQNLLGHEIQTPKSWDTSCLGKKEVEIHDQKDLTCDPCNRRWPMSEVQALINVRTALDCKFLKGVKGVVWEDVAAGLSNMGYTQSAEKCKEKWENIDKDYKRTMQSADWKEAS